MSLPPKKRPRMDDSKRRRGMDEGHAITISRKTRIRTPCPYKARIPYPGKLAKHQWMRVCMGKSLLAADGDQATTSGQVALPHVNNGTGPIVAIPLANGMYDNAGAATGRGAFYSLQESGLWNESTGDLLVHKFQDASDDNDEFFWSTGSNVLRSGIWRFTDINLVLYGRSNHDTKYTVSFVQFPKDIDPMVRIVDANEFDTERSKNYWDPILLSLCQNPASLPNKVNKTYGRVGMRPKILWKRQFDFRELLSTEEAQHRRVLKFRLSPNWMVKWSYNNNAATGQLDPLGAAADLEDQRGFDANEDIQNGVPWPFQNVYCIVSATNYEESAQGTTTTDPSFSFVYKSHYDVPRPVKM